MLHVRKVGTASVALSIAFATVGFIADARWEPRDSTPETLGLTAARMAHAPVDYGLGPGRGRPNPKSISIIQRRGHPIASGTGSGTVQQQGTVAYITVGNGGNYISPPTCALSAPPTGGTPASCSVFAFGAAKFYLPSATVGTWYTVNDILTLNPTTGLVCAIYPTLQVKSVDNAGAVTAIGATTAGQCSTFPTTGAYSFTGGTGAGYSSPVGVGGIGWSVLFAQVTPGGGYLAAPLVTFQASPYGTATATAMLQSPGVPASAAPQGSATAAVQGVFGAPQPWPIIPIHMALLPDGRILNYGSDQFGHQTAALVYDIWDPSLGSGANAHLVLPNVTTTDIFCSGTSVLWTTGQVLMTGGDLTIGGVRNYANNKTTIFNPGTNTLSAGLQMQYPRWYATIVPLPSGEKFVLGGYSTRTPPSGIVQTAHTPEIYNASSGWRTLTGATVGATDYYYPRAFVDPAGNVFEISASGSLVDLTIGGAGSYTYFTHTSAGSQFLPTIMFAPGKILSLRLSSTIVVDINGSKPIVTTTNPVDRLRYDANATLLADGQVLLNGGSTTNNSLAGASYTAQIWSPATGQWTTGATAAKPRLYHSNAILLPDGTVLTAGGGSPGPVINLNAEIYYPPYLYLNDGSGNPAIRPVIASVNIPASGTTVGSTFSFTMSDTAPVSRVTLLRSGAATHANNAEQRFLDLTASASQTGPQVSVRLPMNQNVVLPGYYLLFAFNANGVPSVAKQILIAPNPQPPVTR